MIHDFRFPLQLLPAELDDYLAAGWYRMAQCVFTTDFIERNDELFKAIWLRIRLKGYQPSSTFTKLEKRNRHFDILFTPFRYDSHYEDLYQRYLSGIDGERSRSLAEVLFDFTDNNLFNSLAVQLLDGSKLAGAGIFDLGNKSAAGICCFFDPAYKKYSPGRYLIYKKIEYCVTSGFDFFYPGYFVPGIKAFDYKLKIGASTLEFFQRKQKQWINILYYDPAIFTG